MNRIYGQYRDRATFYVVYIEEAHPIDLWELDSNLEDHVIFTSARTEAERSDTAALCVVRLSIKIPALLDDIDNRTERAYTGWPDRLYIIGTDGRIRYKSAAGPFGFSPRDLEAALVETLGVTRQAPAAE